MTSRTVTGTPSSMPHISLKGNTYYAKLTVPKEARGSLGKLRFVQSTKTGDRRVAQSRANALVAVWKAEIAKHLGKKDDFILDILKTKIDPTILEALNWKQAINESPDADQQEAVELSLNDRAEDIERLQGTSKAQSFADIARGAMTPNHP